MTLAQATFWVALGSFLVGLVAAVAAIIYGRSSHRQGTEQLRLAREEALRHPQLEISAVALQDAKEFEEVVQVREAQKVWRELLDKMQADYPTDALAADVEDKYTVEQATYEGPDPDLVLTFELRNRGRRAAIDVSGEVHFDLHVLSPLKFPGMSGTQFGSSSIKLPVGTVPPWPSEEKRVYKIALRRKRPGKTTAVAIFSTPEGDYLEEPLELDVP